MRRTTSVSPYNEAWMYLPYLGPRLDGSTKPKLSVGTPVSYGRYLDGGFSFTGSDSK